MTFEKIVPLRGPDRVRKRPAVVFGSDGIEGVQRAVEQLLDMFLTEAQLGNCKHIDVTHSGEQLTISADDPGLYLGQDTGDDQIWKNIFCDFVPGPACVPLEDGCTYTGHQELYGGEPVDALFLPEEVGAFELCAIQYVSAYMDVTVVRQGVQSTLHFKKGYAQDGMTCQPTDAPSGTSIHFAMDPEIFSSTQIPDNWLRQTLQRYAILSPGLRCTYRQMPDVQESYCYPLGISEYVHNQGAQLLFGNRIHGKGKERYDRPDYQACVAVAVGLTPERSEALCLHNFRQLIGGSHWEQLKKQICRAFNQCFYKSLEVGPLTFEELSRHLTVVLATWCSPRRSLWENGRRNAICNQLIADMTYDVLDNGFCRFIRDHAEDLRPIVDTIIKARK